jgi:thioredoxin 1
MMKVSTAAFMIVALLLAVVLTGCSREKAESTADTGEEHASTSEARAVAVHQRGLPRLVDLGKGTCIPCKKMAPILEELKREFEGTAVIEVIDLRDDADAATEYGIRLIPTQIFFDSTGVEVWRHEGFLSKDAIVAKLGELGAEPVDK